MRVRHLNCATLCPRLGPFKSVLGDATVLVCHVLLIETDVGLVLVDTGFGVEDCQSPLRRIGPAIAVIAPRFDERETALRQVEGLGHTAADVKHVIVTHLDLDHAGGLPDFPNATVHVMAKEHTAAMQRKQLHEKSRYRTAHWQHGPRWLLHDVMGERWNGFESVRALAGSRDEILLVPLEGHTRGHAGIAVRSDDGWLFHCGDAYFHKDEVTGGRAPSGLEFFQRTVAFDDALRKRNRTRLKELVRNHSGIRVFSAHSESELEALRS